MLKRRRHRFYFALVLHCQLFPEATTRASCRLRLSIHRNVLHSEGHGSIYLRENAATFRILPAWHFQVERRPVLIFFRFHHYLFHKEGWRDDPCVPSVRDHVEFAQKEGHLNKNWAFYLKFCGNDSELLAIGDFFALFWVCGRLYCDI